MQWSKRLIYSTEEKLFRLERLCPNCRGCVDKDGDLYGEGLGHSYSIGMDWISAKQEQIECFRVVLNMKSEDIMFGVQVPLLIFSIQKKHDCN